MRFLFKECVSSSFFLKKNSKWLPLLWYSRSACLEVLEFGSSLVPRALVPKSTLSGGCGAPGSGPHTPLLSCYTVTDNLLYCIYQYCCLEPSADAVRWDQPFLLVNSSDILLLYQEADRYSYKHSTS